MANDNVRNIQVPVAGSGLTFKASSDGRYFVTDVKKSCSSGASPGDEVVMINGERPDQLAIRITKQGDALNTCSAGERPHSVGAVGKFDSPPCISCDFARRRKTLGLDGALSCWIGDAKRNMAIMLSIRSSDGIDRSPMLDTHLSHDSQSALGGSGLDSSTVIKLNGASNTSTMRELKTLRDFESKSSVILQPCKARKVALTERSATSAEILREAANLPEPGFYVRLLAWEMEEIFEETHEETRVKLVAAKRSTVHKQEKEGKPVTEDSKAVLIRVGGGARRRVATVESLCSDVARHARKPHSSRKTPWAKGR